MINWKFTKIYLFLSIFILHSCFEYEESIYFKKDLSGEVHIKYIIPLKKNNQKSLISFLPTQRKEIIEKLNKGLFSNNLQIYDYKFEILEEKRFNQEILKSRNSGKVSYKIKFKKLSQLEGILLGNFLIQQKQKSISVKREFKSVLKPITSNSSLGEKKIHSKTLKLLGDGYLQFRVYFPQNFECTSNKGDIGLGYVYYYLPLVDTIERPGIKSWFYSIHNLE